jgi:hypothetical protein
VIANKYIDTMNAAFKSSIQDVALGPIAAADPFWPPNLVPHGVAPRALIMPASAGKSLDDLMQGKK